MHDALICGRCFRTFNVVDDFNREVLVIEIDQNIPIQQVVRELSRMNGGKPWLSTKTEHGLELISLTLTR